MPQKSPLNPARKLHDTLMAEHGTDFLTIQSALTELSLRWDHMLLPSWDAVLQAQLLKQSERHMLSFSHSHNVATYTTYIHSNASPDQTLFHKTYPRATHVLLLRLQLAPLETMRQDDSLATCRRCHLHMPDTIHHWLLHCPAL